MSASTNADHSAGARGTVTPALELSGVVSGYERTTVVRDVSLSIPASSVTALLGPNGAGKSTLLKTISGVLRPTKGTIRVFGDDVTKLSPARRATKGVCYIPEGRAIFRSLTVRENLVMQSIAGREEAAVERAAEVFPVLRDRLGQLAGTLSGGQQQMLAMARAYIREPEIILVDEASLGLAPLIVDSIFEFLHQLATRGVALLIVDQFLTRALNLADHAYVLNRGEISFSGPATELLGRDVFKEYLGTEG